MKLAKEFNNNTLTRRYLFDYVFEESKFKVLNILVNNMFVIKSLDDLNDVPPCVFQNQYNPVTQTACSEGFKVGSDSDSDSDSDGSGDNGDATATQRQW